MHGLDRFFRIYIQKSILEKAKRELYLLGGRACQEVLDIVNPLGVSGAGGWGVRGVAGLGRAGLGRARRGTHLGKQV